MLAQIGNLNKTYTTVCTIRISKNLLPVLTVLESYGYIRGYKLLKRHFDEQYVYIKLLLAYFDNKPMIRKINFYNKRLVHKKHTSYLTYEELAIKAKNSSGLYIISTNLLGVVPHPEALSKSIGGVVLAYIE